MFNLYKVSTYQDKLVTTKRGSMAKKKKITHLIIVCNDANNGLEVFNECGSLEEAKQAVKECANEYGYETRIDVYKVKQLDLKFRIEIKE